MKKPFLTIGRVVLTLLIVTFAVVLVWRMVMYYMFAPWTRDGHIRADIIQIAPDVSGLIQQVEVKDNQLIKRGQVLFSIDQDRFKLALRQAKAAVADREETLARRSVKPSVTVAWATWCRPSNWKRASRGWPVRNRRWPRRWWRWTVRSSTSTAR
jgi:multidrug resistance efflux pump